MKKTLYVDMDNVLVDFPSGINQLSPETQEEYSDNFDEVPGIFSLMIPMPGAIDAYKELSERFETYILSTSFWKNPSAWSDKLIWVDKYLGKHAHKRLILSHNKQLHIGAYLIDDRPNNGAKDFIGEWIKFGSDKYPNWEVVKNYLCDKPTD